MLNIIQRRQMHRTGRFILTRKFSPSAADTMSASEFAEQLNNHPNFAENAMRFTSSVRGLEAYWSDARKQLRAMIDQLGSPTLFLTLSFADMDLPELDECFIEPKSTNRAVNVTEQPHSSVHFFIRLVHLLFVCCLPVPHISGSASQEGASIHAGSGRAPIWSG